MVVEFKFSLLFGTREDWYQKQEKTWLNMEMTKLVMSKGKEGH